jgi:hypothetical protein
VHLFIPIFSSFKQITFANYNLYINEQFSKSDTNVIKLNNLQNRSIKCKPENHFTKCETMFYLLCSEYSKTWGNVKNR